MAIGTISDVIANLPLVFYDEGQYLWNRQALQVKLSKKNKGRGPSVNWTVSNGGAVVLNRGAGYTVDPATDSFNDDRVKMTLNRGIYSTTFGFTDSERATVESYLGTDAAADIIKDLFRDAYLEHLAALMRQIELDALVGTGTANGQNNIVGFLSALATSGTYAGQTFGGATNPGLISNIQASVGNVTRADIRNMFAQIKQATGYNPDYIMASPLTATYLNGIGDNQIRYFSDGDRDIFRTSAQVPMSGNSVTSILGIPVFENTAWGASTASSVAANADGYVLFGQRNKSLFDVLTYIPAQDALLSQIREGQSAADNQAPEGVGLPVRCWAQAKTAASIVINMDIELQMAVLAPNAFGLMTGVTGFTPNT
jgi:hypothetical protein